MMEFAQLTSNERRYMFAVVSAYIFVNLLIALMLAFPVSFYYFPTDTNEVGRLVTHCLTALMLPISLLYFLKIFKPFFGKVTIIKGTVGTGMVYTPTDTYGAIESREFFLAGFMFWPPAHWRRLLTKKKYENTTVRGFAVPLTWLERKFFGSTEMLILLNYGDLSIDMEYQNRLRTYDYIIPAILAVLFAAATMVLCAIHVNDDDARVLVSLKVSAVLLLLSLCYVFFCRRHNKKTISEIMRRYNSV